MLERLVLRSEPLYAELAAYTRRRGREGAWRTHLHTRLEQVWRWVEQCRDSARYL